MKVELKKSHISDYRGNLLCVFLMQDEEPPHTISEFRVRKERYEGKLLQTYVAETQGKAGFRYLLVVGLGKKEDFRMDNLRRAAGIAVRFSASIKEKEFAMHTPAKFIPPAQMNEMAQAMSEGAILAAHKFTEYKTKKEDLFSVEKAHIISESDISQGIMHGTAMAGAQNYAREIDEQPANVMSPAAMVREAQKLAKSHRLSLSVFDKNKLKKMRMNGILAVCQGSRNDPYLVKLEYNKDKKYPLYCIVGKGVTFDTGGISIKPAQNMHEMKYDKTGAVNVLGIMRAVAELKLPIRVMGLMPLVENMPSNSAQRPGDIIKAYNGKTIEVLNTDAEGRLILADALAYGAEYKPEFMIDMATLTGAIMICLGRHAIGLMSNDDLLSSRLSEAGDRTFERVWRLPLWPEYGELMKSEIADLKNISEVPDAGSITAAAFLREFVGETKWAHLDIAAVDLVKWPHAYLEKGATCMGVRLVTETLASFAKK
jgi:leucyl aminopeptidase